jgi:hypothetical protein
MNRLLTLAFVVVIALIAVAVVHLFTQKGQDDKRTTEIIDGMIEACKQVSSYNYSMTVFSVSNGFFENSQVNIETLMKGDGFVDIRNKRMYTPLSINIKGFTAGNPVTSHSELEMYVIGNTLYSRAGNNWFRQELNGDVWSKTQLEQQNAIVKGAYARNTGIEELNGVEVYVIQYTPNPSNLVNYALEVMGKSSAQQGVETLRDYTVAQWISTKTLLPVKTMIKFTSISQNMTNTLGVVSEYKDFNSTMEIRLPEEAANATIL